MGALSFDDVRKLGVVLKRAQYFILCGGRSLPGMGMEPDAVLRALVSEARREALPGFHQLSMFDGEAARGWDTADARPMPTEALMA